MPAGEAKAVVRRRSAPGETRPVRVIAFVVLRPLVVARRGRRAETEAAVDAVIPVAKILRAASRIDVAEVEEAVDPAARDKTGKLARADAAVRAVADGPDNGPGKVRRRREGL